MFSSNSSLCSSFRKREVVDSQVWSRVLRPLSAGDSAAEASVPHLQGRGEEGRPEADLPLDDVRGGGEEVSGGSKILN